MKKIIRYDKKKLPVPVYEECPEWVKLYYAAWEMAFGNVEYSSKRGWLPQLICMPGSGKIWQWDSCFMSLFARYSNGELSGMNNLDNLYSLQREDGHQSMAYVIETGKPAYGERVNPPLFAWVEWEYYLVTGDSSRFEKVLPKLSQYYKWLKKNRMRDNGLYWFEDTGSSGMDNSPRSAFPSATLKGSDVCWIDLIAQQALSASKLAKIAGSLGQKNDEKFYLAEHKELCDLINRHHWCERHGFYYDVFEGGNHPSRLNFLNTKTAAAFWPILCGAADENKINRLVAHIMDPDEFWTYHPIPTLSKDDANYDPFGCYWCGGVWAPTNYMAATGLKKHGRTALAREIAAKHLDALAEVMGDKSYGSIWECYSPEYKRPATKNDKGDIVRNNFIGWSGLGPVAMLIENILGFTFDAQANTVRWEIASSKPNGIKNICFNGGRMALVCGSTAAPGKREIKIETDRAFSLSIKLAGRSGEKSWKLKAGRHDLNI